MAAPPSARRSDSSQAPPITKSRTTKLLVRTKYGGVGAPAVASVQIASPTRLTASSTSATASPNSSTSRREDARARACRSTKSMLTGPGSTNRESTSQNSMATDSRSRDDRVARRELALRKPKAPAMMDAGKDSMDVL